MIGLTATPVAALTEWQRTLHDELFGAADFVVATPALVKEGDLAPYQELVYLTEPTPMRRAGSRLTAPASPSSCSSSSTNGWAACRSPCGSHPIVDRSTSDGSQVAWSTFERAEPDLARSGLRFAHDG